MMLCRCVILANYWQFTLVRLPQKAIFADALFFLMRAVYKSSLAGRDSSCHLQEMRVGGGNTTDPDAILWVVVLLVVGNAVPPHFFTYCVFVHATVFNKQTIFMQVFPQLFFRRTLMWILAHQSLLCSLTSSYVLLQWRLIMVTPPAGASIHL